MKRVLILTYYWPPAGGPGVQRWLKFVKYLEGFGWEPQVLTVREGTYSALDHELEKEVPEGLPVYKTRNRDPFRFYNLLKGKKNGSVSVALININKERSIIDRLSMYIRSNFFIPDARKGWVPYAVKEALSIFRREHIDLLVTTGPPHSTHLAGLRLKKKTGISWIADLRDPWTTVYYNEMLPRTVRTKNKDKRLEDEVLYHADAVTVVSPGMRKEFLGRNANTHVVMNGFDMEDMASPVESLNGHEKFSITYTGNFKPNQHIPAIWDALCELLDENEDFNEDLILRFVGNLDATVPEYFAGKGRSDKLEIIPYVPHGEVTGIMAASSALLFVIPQSVNNRLIITGKLFEYLASGPPILPVGPADGDAAAVLLEAGREQMLDYNSKAQIKERVLQLYRGWQTGNLTVFDASVLERYSRLSSAGKMAEIMNEIIRTP